MASTLRHSAEAAHMRQTIQDASATRAGFDDLFELTRQPIFDLSTNRVSHHELLLRLRTDDGQVGPAEFAPAIKQLGLEERLDLWVTARAVLMLVPDHPEGPQLEVNLSPKTIVSKGFPDELSAALVRREVGPDALIVEVEQGGSVAPKELGPFARRRFRLAHQFSAIDIERNGYKELNRLSSLPYDFLKIDGDFIRELPDRPGDQGVVAHIARMVSRAGRRSVALHVESEETVALLRDAGVGYGQGYYFGKPELLSSARRHRAA